MANPDGWSAAPRPSGPAARLVAYFDPARDGFVRRMMRLAAALAGFVALAALLGLAGLLGRPMGRYAVSATLLEVGWPSMAVRVSERLLEIAPAENGAFYALHAASLRRLGRDEEQIRTLEAGLAAMPEVGLVHSDYCWYGTLYEDTVPVDGAGVDGSCDRAVELARDGLQLGLALGRRGMRRAHAHGDLAGAARDLAEAFAAWEAAGVRVERQPRPWEAWRATIDAGRDPLAGEALGRERERY